MDRNDWFRDFFSFRHRPYRSTERMHDEFENDISEMDGVFNHFHDEMRKQIGFINQQMDDMFRSFGSVDFSQEQYQPAIDSEAHDDSLRKHMLKESERPSNVPAIPDFHDHRYNSPSLFGGFFHTPRWDTRGHRMDNDLDEEVDERSVDRLFEESSDGAEPRVYTSSKSFSMTRTLGADADKSEERRIVRLPNGSEKTTVTRRVDDKSHSIVTVKDKYGKTETNETLNNMDDDDLPAFQKKWNETNRRDQQALPEDSHQNNELTPRHDDNQSLYDTFFGFRPRF